jgi:hypothetical protein
MITGVRSGIGLTRLIGFDRTNSVKLRQDGTNNGMPVGWPRRNDSKAGSQDIANHEELMVAMKASQERMEALMDVSLATTEAFRRKD